jgi:hypothetical protein
MSQKSQELIFRLVEHIELIRTDQADFLGHFGELERLIEDYRTFITAFDLPSEHDKQRQALFQRTHELLGEKQIGIKGKEEGSS